MGIHLSWSALPPTSTNVGLLFGVESVPPTMSGSEILPEVGYVPLTTGQSVSRVFFEGFIFGVGLVPQLVVVPSPSSPGSLISWP